MSRITLDITDEEAKRKLLSLAAELNVKVSLEESERNGEKIAKLMQEISQGNILNAIDSPVHWQRNVRKDRKLRR